MINQKGQQKTQKRSKNTKTVTKKSRMDDVHKELKMLI